MINPQLFAEAYTRGFQSTVRFLMSRGASADEAEEVAQGAWVRGWEAKSQLQSECRVIPWINSIAFRNFCNEKRHARRYTELCETPDTRFAPTCSTAKVDLQVLMSKCSELDRSLLIHRFVGFTTRQIARLHNLSEIATRVRIHRTRKVMRECATEAA
jgi:DNA-directed RNA polymerase specialized sigma24 family protein